MITQEEKLEELRNEIIIYFDLHEKSLEKLEIYQNKKWWHHIFNYKRKVFYLWSEILYYNQMHELAMQEYIKMKDESNIKI